MTHQGLFSIVIGEEHRVDIPVYKQVVQSNQLREEITEAISDEELNTERKVKRK